MTLALEYKYIMDTFWTEWESPYDGLFMIKILSYFFSSILKNLIISSNITFLQFVLCWTFTSLGYLSRFHTFTYFFACAAFNYKIFRGSFPIHLFFL